MTSGPLLSKLELQFTFCATRVCSSNSNLVTAISGSKLGLGLITYQPEMKAFPLCLDSLPVKVLHRFSSSFSFFFLPLLPLTHERKPPPVFLFPFLPSPAALLLPPAPPTTLFSSLSDSLNGAEAKTETGCF